MIKRNDLCWCQSGKKWKKCHYPLQGSKNIKEQYWNKHEILIKDAKQIAGIAASCQLAAKILNATCEIAQEGITTLELNNFAERLHHEAGAIAAPLNYGTPPFPKSICTSINEVICHGIPEERPLKNGDILNIDITCILNGFYGDCSRMVMIGNVDEEGKRLVDVTYECLMRAIDVLKPGLFISTIGEVIENHAKEHNFSVVNQFVGHGVGVQFHEGPQIPHCYNSIHIPLHPGMTFTIEPMINVGVREAVIDPYDHWTARTADGKRSAQWEHTILITEDGHEILTPWER